LIKEGIEVFSSRCPAGEENVSKIVFSQRQTENVHSKIHTIQTHRRHSSFFNNLVYCEEPQCRTIHTISQLSATHFKRSSSKEPLTRTCISLFSAEKPFQGFQPKTPFVHHPPPSSQFILFRLFGAVSVKCCESFAYVAPFDVSLYILKNY